MKKNKLNLPAFIILATIIMSCLISSCKKDNIEPVVLPTTTTTTTPTNSTISASIGGTIVDEADNPVDGATVTIGSNTVSTNAFGAFLITGANVDSERAYIKVEKTGYFNGSRVIKASTTATSSIKIKLLSNSATGSVNNSTGGIVANAGASVIFTSNDVALANGTQYSGNVNVAMSFLDPSDTDLGERMPGDLLGLDANSEEMLLETFGMIAVELTGDAGEELNVAVGEEVEIRIPLSGSYLTDAPSTIPLWYFDETSGIWKEEGQATLVGNEYVGTVSHFTFWNCDNPNPSTTIEGTLECDGNSTVGVTISMTNPSGRVLGYATTDGAGMFDGNIPQNTVLVMDILDACGSVMFSQSIGPFSSATDLGIIEVCFGGLNTGTISGTLEDCSGNPEPNSILNVSFQGITVNIFPDASGMINSSMAFCSATSVDLMGYDLATAYTSTPVTINTGATMNFGTLKLCNVPDEYINYNLDGTDFSLYDYGSNEVSSQVWNSKTHINAWEPNGLNSCNFSIDGLGLGTFPVVYDSIQFNINQYYTSWNSTSMLIDVTFTSYGSTVGSYIEGTFTGTFDDNQTTPVNHAVFGDFRIRRNF